MNGEQGDVPPAQSQPDAAGGPAAAARGPVRLFSKAIIDPVNTIAWFAMDALWLGRVEWPAYAAAAAALATGLLLLVLSRRDGRGGVFEALGLNCWIVMNAVWLVHDLNGRETPRAFAAVVGVLGGVFLLAAARHSRDIRRLRILSR